MFPWEASSHSVNVFPEALQGIEASFMAMCSLRKLGSSFFLKFVWSYRQLLANVGAVLSLLHGLQGVILHAVLYGFGFGWFGGILLTALFRWVGVIACWIWSGKVAMRMAPSIWWSPVPLILGFSEIRSCLVGCTGLLVLSNLAGPIQHFESEIFDAWQDKVTTDLSAREGFRGGPLLDIAGTLQLLNSFLLPRKR